MRVHKGKIRTIKITIFFFKKLLQIQLWGLMIAIPAMGGEDRIVVQGQTGKNVSEIISKNKLGIGAHAFSPSYAEGRGRRIKV
jgi:hypothetical protein